ncbi:hypothetical protein B0H14DRAFT_2572998 [Mycena olivaceomarginata]|nr:hypothetical protein B0H14DRAFT_2572998 [Mycena olivaceomarginata]
MNVIPGINEKRKRKRGKPRRHHSAVGAIRPSLPSLSHTFAYFRTSDPMRALVTTVHFTDGQTFYDILKILPRNEPLVHCIRSFQRYRVTRGMHCMPLLRLERLAVFIKDYEYWSRVSEKYGKAFYFFKQHATSHIVEDIRNKRTTDHGSTRPGEGFQQEAADAYEQTNFKNVAMQLWIYSQMDRIDETQQAVARIRMAIDEYDRHRELDELEDDPEMDDTATTSRLSSCSASWRFRAPGPVVNSKALKEYQSSAGLTVPNFDSMLRDFISEQFPMRRSLTKSLLKTWLHDTLRSDFSNWRGLRDIVRCNPFFHAHLRYDGVLVNREGPGFSFARIHALLRCTLESKRQIDIALVHDFRKSVWKSKTFWDGCQVNEEVKDFSLLLMDYVTRKGLLTPVPENGKENLHFLVDTIDADMFLRADKCWSLKYGFVLHRLI